MLGDRRTIDIGKFRSGDREKIPILDLRWLK
jgi:hypothetical protein